MTRIIASSLLITGILLIRAVFRKKISPLVLYPIWLLAAFRLLMPGMLFYSPVSVMNTDLWHAGSRMLAEEEDRQDMESKMRQYQEYCDNLTAAAQKAAGEEPFREQEGDTHQIAQSGKGMGEENGKEWTADKKEEAGAWEQENVDVPAESVEIKWRMPGTLLGKMRWTARCVWMMGMLVTAVVFLWQNLSFYRYLRTIRKKVPAPFSDKSRLPVFLAGDKLSSPCLFGLFPAVYIPDECVDPKDKEQLDFILTHELMHYRHGDHIWAFIRILCLVINWYNPLVWIAARLSLRDGELACDAGCIRKLGEEKRCAYGEALLAMIVRSKEKEQVLKTATMMTSGKAFMQRRMEEIAQKRKTSVTALIILVISLFFMTGCTYTGGHDARETNHQEPSSATAETNPGQAGEADEAEETEGAKEADETEAEAVKEVCYRGEALAVKGTGEGLNGNLQGVVILFLPGPEKEHTDERYAVLLSDDLYLPDLSGQGRKLEKILTEYTDQEILAVLNRNLALDLEEIEVWDYGELMERVDKIGGIMADVREGAFGRMDRWNQVISTLLQKEGRKIISCDTFMQEGLGRYVYLEDGEWGNELLCLQWEEELARLHELYYPGTEYESSDYVKEADQAMKAQAEKDIAKEKSEAVRTAWLFTENFGASPYVISLLSNASLDAETYDAWRTVEVYVSGREIMVDEEGGRALFQLNLVFEDSGVLGLPERRDGYEASVERFLYLKKGEDGWYVDGLLHNDLPPAKWWDGGQMQWNIYDFGFSDEDTAGIVTTSQAEYDSFVEEVQEAVRKREQIGE